MSEEEIKKLMILINNKDIFYYEDDFNNIIRPLVGKLYNLYNKTKIELNSLKEIEHQHKSDNGLLRQELDMQIEHNKELEAVNKRLRYTMNNAYLLDYIPIKEIEDKIEKLERELQKVEQMNPCATRYDAIQKLDNQIAILEELLKDGGE